MTWMKTSVKHNPVKKSSEGMRSAELFIANKELAFQNE